MHIYLYALAKYRGNHALNTCLGHVDVLRDGGHRACLNVRRSSIDPPAFDCLSSVLCWGCRSTGSDQCAHTGVGWLDKDGVQTTWIDLRSLPVSAKGRSLSEWMTHGPPIHPEQYPRPVGLHLTPILSLQPPNRSIDQCIEPVWNGRRR